jgi:hypothetical protein
MGIEICCSLVVKIEVGERVLGDRRVILAPVRLELSVLKGRRSVRPHRFLDSSVIVALGANRRLQRRGREISIAMMVVGEVDAMALNRHVDG